MTKKVYIFDDYVTSLRNGIGTYIKELSHCLNAIGCSVTFIVLNSEYDNFTVKKKGRKRYFYFPKFPNKPSLIPEKNKIIGRFLRLNIEDGSDNVFFFNHSPAYTLMKVIKHFYPSSKLIYIIHDLAWSISLLGNVCQMKQIMGQKRTNKKNKNILESWKMQLKTMDIAHAVVCLSEDTFRFLSETSLTISLKTHIIPNALRFDKQKYPTTTKQELRKIFGISQSENILLFVGRMTESKGINALLKALATLRENRNIRLAIAGSQATLNLNCFSEVMSKVIYLGHIDKQKLYQWYKIADIGIITSYTEQCSYTGLEMMLHELPIIASDGFGVRCMFRNEINAVTASITDWTSDNAYVRNIANAIIKLVDNKEIKTQLILNAQKILKQKYSIKLMKANYKHLLSSI